MHIELNGKKKKSGIPRWKDLGKYSVRWKGPGALLCLSGGAYVNFGSSSLRASSLNTGH